MHVQRRCVRLCANVSATAWVALAGSLMLQLPGTVRAQESAASSTCVPWAGEMSPLPTGASPDRFAARWAELRARELRILAAGVESQQPILARRLRDHANCMVRDETPSVASSRNTAEPLGPSIAYRPRPQLPPRPPRVPTSPPPPRVDFDDIDERMRRADEEIAAARFKQALVLAEDARERLDPKPDGDARERRLIQVEVLSATALVALGRSAEAAASFERALALQPDLELDELTTPPKILRLFARVRETGSAPPTEGAAP